MGPTPPGHPTNTSESDTADKATTGAVKATGQHCVGPMQQVAPGQHPGLEFSTILISNPNSVN